jgi:hypothetical protein
MWKQRLFTPTNLRTVSQGLCGENLGPRACLFFISRYTFYYTVDRK